MLSSRPTECDPFAHIGWNGFYARKPQLRVPCRTCDCNTGLWKGSRDGWVVGPRGPAQTLHMPSIRKTFCLLIIRRKMEGVPVWAHKANL
eukprot:1161353-Pelagomonas_calceolata.AAC.9